MAVIMCVQLSISHNAFFFPPPRKAFLRPYIYHILQEALSGKQDSQAVSRRIVLTKSSRSTKAFCLKTETWRRSCFKLEGGIHSCWGFTVEKRFNDSDVWGSKTEHTVLLGHFKKTGGYMSLIDPLGCVGISQRSDIGNDRKNKSRWTLSVWLCGSLFQRICCMSQYQHTG